MRLGLLTLSVIALAAGCSPELNPCVSGTVFATVTLEGAAKDATQLLIDVSVGGGAPLRTTLTHEPGAAIGGVQIEFPKGYPKGETITVTIQAQLSGTTIATQTKAITLGGGCVATTFVLSAATPSDAGMDGPAVDLIEGPDGGDLATTSSDDLLTTDDLESPSDLTDVPRDLIGCVPATENCFNGVDDDCDNKIDCADENCTAGASPLAACVPSPGTFIAGTTVSGTCPTAWPTTMTINSDLTHSCTQTCGGCGNPVTQCAAALLDAGGVTNCASSVSYGIPQGECVRVDLPAGTHHAVSIPYAFELTCDPPSGTTTKTGPTWGNTERFCSGGAVGGGCAVGSICVPAAPNHCVIKAGDTSTLCPASYQKRPTRYYTGFDDSARVCSCGCQKSFGSCTGTPVLTRHTTSTCGDGFSLISNSCTNEDYSSTPYFEVFGLTVQTNGSCSADASAQIAPTLQNEQTVCCLP